MPARPSRLAPLVLVAVALATASVAAMALWTGLPPEAKALLQPHRGRDLPPSLPPEPRPELLPGSPAAGFLGEAEPPGSAPGPPVPPPAEEPEQPPSEPPQGLPPPDEPLPEPAAGADGGSSGTRLALTIRVATAEPREPFDAFDGHPPKVFDFDGDGRQEILLHNDNRFVYVFDARTGMLLAELTTTCPKPWGARPLNGVEAAVLVRGEAPSLVVANSAAVVTVFRFEGVGADGRFLFEKAWERRLDDCHKGPGMDSKVTLADLDADGRVEILAQTEEEGLFALRDNGQVYWKRCLGGGNAEPTVGDLDGDGRPEVVWVSDGGWVTATSGLTGASRWSFHVGDPAHELGSGSMPAGAAVRDVDGQPGAEVIVGVRDSSDCVDYENNHVALFALRGNGSLLWKRQQDFSNPLTYTHPVVVDADRDGAVDIFWADWNTQGHQCGAWERLGDAWFYRYDAEGKLRWRQNLSTFWGNKDLVLADVDGDGAEEVLANGPGGPGLGYDGIWYLDGATGAREAFVSAWPWKVTRAPVAGDLWGTGTLQWVLPVYSYGPESRCKRADGTPFGCGAVLVFDTGQPARAAWPHRPQAEPAPGPGRPPEPPPPERDFRTEYRVPGGATEWWLEVKVDSNLAVERVEARVDGGAWFDLPRQAWGGWAESVHVPRGSEVVFRATSPSGATALSSAFAWLGSAAASDPAGPFEAAFEPRSQGNRGWVEVLVRASHPLAGVEARIGDGEWTPLRATDWGTWARSLAVPAGTSVVFRAADEQGRTATSVRYAW